MSIARSFLFKIKPNILRVAYDAISLTLLASITFFFMYGFFSRTDWWLFLFVPSSLLINFLLGIYTKYKVAGGLKKMLLLSVSIAASMMIFWLAGVNLDSLVLVGLFSWLASALPRYFLNLHSGSNRGFIDKAIQQKGPVLIVGGAGYIGSHLVAELLKKNKKVRVLDKLLYGDKSLSEFRDDPRFEFIDGDVTDVSKVSIAVSGASAVVHLAGLVGDPACAVDEEFTRHTNVIATRMIKDVAKSFGIERFVFASSCSVYGASDIEVAEGSSLNPVSIYAKTKIDSEAELLSSDADDFHVTVLRFATVFGYSRRPRFDLVANLFAWHGLVNGKITVTGPNQWRPFIHVKDLARAIAIALDAPLEKISGEIFNVGDSKLNMTIGQLGDVVSKLITPIRKVEVVVNNDVLDKRNYVVSFQKIKKVLGFEASIDMKAGVQEMIEEIQKSDLKDISSPVYSNLETTKVAVKAFRDPMQSSNLYQPVFDVKPSPEG